MLNLPNPKDYWAFIADEITDINRIEQFTFVLRSFDDNLVINERFFGFWAVPDTFSQTLYEHIN